MCIYIYTHTYICYSILYMLNARPTRGTQDLDCWGLGALSGLPKLQTSTPPRLPITNPSDRRDSRSVGCFRPGKHKK